jgi:hypothetical protein
MRLKWQPEFITKWQKIKCMRMEFSVFLESVSFLPWSLRKLHEAFGFTAIKSWYPHSFNRSANMHYVGKMPTLVIMEQTRATGRGRSFWIGILFKRLKFLTTDACLKSNIKRASLCCVRHARSLGEGLSRSETLRFSSNR